MRVGDRVKTITSREGRVQRLFTDDSGREVAEVVLDSDSAADLPLDIPVGCLRVLPFTSATGGSDGK